MKPELEFVFELRGTLAEPHALGQTPHGVRRVVPITGGVFEGPKLIGEIKQALVKAMNEAKAASLGALVGRDAEQWAERES